MRYPIRRKVLFSFILLISVFLGVFILMILQMNKLEKFQVRD